MIYFKVAGALIIFLSSIIFGLNIVKESNLVLAQIKETIKFYENFKNEVDYNSNDIASAINNSIKNTNFVHKDAFKSFAEQIKDSNSVSFSDAWSRCNKAGYSKATIEIMNSFCSDLRIGDTMEYKNCADRQIELLNKVLDNKLNQNRQNNKLTMYISALSGIFIILILI